MRSQHSELAIGRKLPASIPAEAKSPDRFWGQATSLFNGPQETFARGKGGRGVRLIDLFPSSYEPKNKWSYTSYAPVRLSGAKGQTWLLALPVQALATNFQKDSAQYRTLSLRAYDIFLRFAGKVIGHILTISDSAYNSRLSHSTPCHKISAVRILSLSRQYCNNNLKERVTHLTW
jgi:hypothetical protein